MRTPTIHMPRSINAFHILWMLIVLQLVVFIFMLSATPTDLPRCEEDQPCWNPCTMGNLQPCNK